MTPHEPTGARVSTPNGLGVPQADQTLERASVRQERGSMSENLREQIQDAILAAHERGEADWASAAMSVVAPELDRLRAEVEPVQVSETMVVPRCALPAWKGMREAQEREVDAVLRAERAEAECAVLRERLARVEALLTGWLTIPDYAPSEYDKGRVDQRHMAAEELSAALESVTEPSDSEPAPDADREAGGE